MSIPQHVIDKFTKSLTDTLTYYTSMPGDHRKEIAAIIQALDSGIGKPESSEGVSLAVKYKEELTAKLNKATPNHSGSNQNALNRRRAQLATRKANANRANANRANTRKTRVGSPLAANARRQVNALRNLGKH